MTSRYERRATSPTPNRPVPASCEPPTVIEPKAGRHTVFVLLVPDKSVGGCPAPIHRKEVSSPEKRTSSQRLTPCQLEVSCGSCLIPARGVASSSWRAVSALLSASTFLGLATCLITHRHVQDLCQDLSAASICTRLGRLFRPEHGQGEGNDRVVQAYERPKGPMNAADAGVTVTDTESATAASGDTVVNGHGGPAPGTGDVSATPRRVSGTSGQGSPADSCRIHQVSVEQLTKVRRRARRQPYPWPHQVGVIPPGWIAL
jgi:hypothetical protein